MFLFKGNFLEHIPFIVVHLCVFQCEIHLQFNRKLLLGSQSYSNLNHLSKTILIGLVFLGIFMNCSMKA